MTQGPQDPRWDGQQNRNDPQQPGWDGSSQQGWDGQDTQAWGDLGWSDPNATSAWPQQPPHTGPQYAEQSSYTGAHPVFSDSAPPSGGKSFPWIFVALGAVVALAIATVVVVLTQSGSDDKKASGGDPGSASSEPSAQPSSGGTEPQGLAYFTKQRLDDSFEIVSEYAGKDPVYRITLVTDGSTSFEMCDPDQEEVTTYAIVDGEVEEGDTRDQRCFDGFDPDDLGTGTIKTIIADASGLSASTNISALIAAWDSTTPTVLLTDLDTDDIEEYDLDGNLLGPVVNPLKQSERDAAIKTLVEASGLTQAVELCAFVAGNSVTLAGIDPDDSDSIIVWEYTNYAKEWNSWDLITEQTFDPVTANLADPIAWIGTIEAEFTGLEAWNVCISTEEIDGQVIVRYDLSEPGTYNYDHKAVVALDGTIISTE